LDICRRQFLLRRHPGPLVPDGAEEQALLGCGGIEHWPTVASAAQPRSRVQAQPAALLLGAVALLAVLDQDGSNLRLEEAHFLCRRCGRGDGGDGRDQEKQEREALHGPAAGAGGRDPSSVECITPPAPTPALRGLLPGGTGGTIAFTACPWAKP